MIVVVGALCALTAGCKGPVRSSVQTPKTPGGFQDSSVRRSDTRRVVLFVGTSLTAGLGVDPDSAFPAVIQRRLDSLHLPYRAVNAGVSGETSAGALRRLPWLLREPFAILVLETGANDGLRGLDPDSTRANIVAIVRAVRAHDAGTRIVLVGMEAPPNMGPRFTRAFRALFPDLARREHLALVPFLLAGVGGVDSLNQSDGIHPNPRGHDLVARNVWRVLGSLLMPDRRTAGPPDR